MGLKCPSQGRVLAGSQTVEQGQPHLLSPCWSQLRFGSSSSTAWLALVPRVLSPMTRISQGHQPPNLCCLRASPTAVRALVPEGKGSQDLEQSLAFSSVRPSATPGGPWGQEALGERAPGQVGNKEKWTLGMRPSLEQELSAPCPTCPSPSRPHQEATGSGIRPGLRRGAACLARGKLHFLF